MSKKISSEPEIVSMHSNLICAEPNPFASIFQRLTKNLTLSPFASVFFYEETWKCSSPFLQSGTGVGKIPNQIATSMIWLGKLLGSTISENWHRWSPIQMEMDFAPGWACFYGGRLGCQNLFSCGWETSRQPNACWDVEHYQIGRRFSNNYTNNSWPRDELWQYPLAKPFQTEKRKTDC